MGGYFLGWNMYFENGSIALSVLLELSEQCCDIVWNFIQKNSSMPNKLDGKLNDIIIDTNNCNSEIEKLFLLSFRLLLLDNGNQFIQVIPQHDIFISDKRYVADFLIFDRRNPDYKLIVECDGHNYHKISKYQVDHDNKRDYDLKLHGYDILHFSGSKLKDNPDQCAKDVLNYIKEKVGRC